MYRLLISSLMVSSVLFGASPVATVTSSKTFQLSGARVPVNGVPDWPLLAGDKVEMGEASGTIRFRDGTLLYVLPHSKLAIQAVDKHARVRLEDGGLTYKYAKDSTVELSASSHKPLPERTGTGRLLISGDEAWWNPDDPALFSIRGVVRREGGGLAFGEYRLTPSNPDFTGRWREYSLQRGGINPPGPPPGVHPPGLGPPWRPPGLSKHKPQS